MPHWSNFFSWSSSNIDRLDKKQQIFNPLVRLSTFSSDIFFCNSQNKFLQNRCKVSWKSAFGNQLPVKQSQTGSHTRGLFKAAFKNISHLITLNINMGWSRIHLYWFCRKLQDGRHCTYIAEEVYNMKLLKNWSKNDAFMQYRVMTTFLKQVESAK